MLKIQYNTYLIIIFYNCSTELQNVNKAFVYITDFTLPLIIAQSEGGGDSEMCLMINDIPGIPWPLQESALRGGILEIIN